MRKAFSMIELVFVIVVIGILGAIAIPKFTATRDDAILAKAKTTVANVRSALSSEVQKKILEGNYTAITGVGGTKNSYNSQIFDFFEINGTTITDRVLEYPIRSCKDANARGCWLRTGAFPGDSASTYRFRLPASIGGDVDFNVSDNRFNCTSSWSKCKYLEK